jgi:choline dehydrogenase
MDGRAPSAWIEEMSPRSENLAAGGTAGESGVRGSGAAAKAKQSDAPVAHGPKQCSTGGGLRPGQANERVLEFTMSETILGRDTNRSRTETSAAAKQKARAETIDRRFDFIVCGAGTSGSVIAGRLAANPDVNVLLLEAGGSDELDLVMDPTLWVKTIGSELDWGFVAAPNSQLNGRAIPYSMGKVLGGGSSVNVLTWSRGHKADWDAYAAEADDPAWGYEAVLELYRRRIEDWRGSRDPDYRGSGGPMYVQPAPDRHPFFHSLLEAAESNGFHRFESPNGRMMEADGGCAVVDEIVKDGRRQSVFRSYVHPRTDQANLTVLTQALVTRVVFKGNRATGVEVLCEGKLRRFEAALEIIASLGAIQTPKLLMQSGVGDQAELAKFDIPIVADLPGVGRNLHDHAALGCVWDATEKPRPRAPRSQAVCFWKTNSALDAPNFYLYGNPGPVITPENQTRFRPPASSWSLFVGMRPASRGVIRLTGPDPFDPLDIEANYLADPLDLENWKIGVARARQIGNAAAFRAYARSEVAPGELDGAALEQFIRNGLVTFWHQCGTARMGRDKTSVVDGRLKVHGIEGLRVADGSVLPRVTTGNTMAPCVVIGERAAALLQDEHGASMMARGTK